MRINTNVASLNAYKNLQGVQGSIAKSMEKLSSGLRINNASDDAAGMGISNKMRADIRAMNQAGRNAEQANALGQIAEGSVQSIQKILERMKELATQSASDTVDGDATTGGRSRIKAEFDELHKEITRITDTTKFQGTALLNGDFGTKVTADSITQSGIAKATVSASPDTYTISVQDSVGDGTGTPTTMTLTNGAGDTQIIDVSALKNGEEVDFSTFGVKVQVFDTTQMISALNGTATTTTGAGGTFMVGSSGEYAGQDNLTLKLSDMSAAALNLDTAAVDSVANAQTTLGTIDTALATVAEALGNIGAFQNRLSFAQDNLKTAVTNLSAADSVVRDLDIAAEMTSFSKNNILSQAGTAMLAQANQMGQGVLQLLRG